MTACPYDLILGLDRSDQKAELCLIDPHSAQRGSVVIDSLETTATYTHVITGTDYRHEHRHRTLTLSAMEVIRRFLMHVLPHGFMRIRYFGFLANAHREEQLRKIRKLLDVLQPTIPVENPVDDQHELDRDGHDLRWPQCLQGMMSDIDLGPRPRLSEILKLPLLAPT